MDPHKPPSPQNPMYTLWKLEGITFPKDPPQANSVLPLSPEGNPKLFRYGRDQWPRRKCRQTFKPGRIHLWGVSSVMGQNKAKLTLHTESWIKSSTFLITLLHFFLIASFSWAHINHLLLKIPCTLFDGWKGLPFLRTLLHQQIPSCFFPRWKTQITWMWQRQICP